MDQNFLLDDKRLDTEILDGVELVHEQLRQNEQQLSLAPAFREDLG